ncbi:MAG: hypothetical protein ACREBJ_12140, partial [Nitrosotalea sp.]
LLVDGSGVTQPISAVALPLPAGAATETTLSTRLADSTFTGRINTQGQKAMSASTPVVIASDQTPTPGKTSVGNTTTTPLAANATFTGVFESVKDYSFLSFSIISDQASAADGLVFQWSSDGINIDRSEATNLVANAGRAFAIEVRAAYFRVVYTNGSTNQTTFRVRTDYHVGGTGLITKPIKGSVTDDNFAQLVQSTLLGRNSDGSFSQIDNFSDTGTNALHVAEMQYIFQAPNNQTTANLAAGATFTGLADSTLGANAIRVNIKADQPLTVLVQQSADGTNWDVSDRYTLMAGVGDGRVVQSVASFVRVLVTNTGVSTATYLRLETTLCPESEATPRMPMENIQGTITASGNVLGLNNNGYANTGVQITGTWSGTIEFEVSSDDA